MAQISEADMGWLGGIVDGEGTIGASPLRKRYISYYFYCRVYNTNPLIVNESARIIEGIIGKRPGIDVVNRSKTNRTIFHVRVENRSNVITFLTAILPYLRGKRHDAEIVLAMAKLMATRRHGNKWTGVIPIPAQVDILLAELKASRVYVGNPEPSPAGVVSSGEGATVSPVSPNNNPGHERATSLLG
jgi:hypothetical protein